MALEAEMETHRTERLPLPDATELEKVMRDTFHLIKETSLSEVTATVSKRDVEQIPKPEA